MSALMSVLQQARYASVTPDILQEAAPFLDLGGEEIRASLFFTTDQTGRELCLRPEFTIPVCRAYLTSADAGTPTRYSCAGPVFRMRAGEPAETLQVGLESFGRTDTAAADAEVLGLASEAVRAAAGGSLTTIFGDAGLLASLLDALRLPALWQRRLKRGLDKGESAATVLAAAPTTAADHSGVLAAMAGTDAAGARALVDDLLSIAGIASVGGRSASEIAERFLSQVALRAAPPFGPEQRSILDRYLAIAGEPDAAALALRALAEEAGLDLSAALDLFEARISLMAIEGVDLATTRFSGAFGRNLDYYTGFVFEARLAGLPGGPVLVGGRYDRLAQALGSTVPVPAVGAAIWVDTLHPGQGTPR
ncbi:ATP phosphoribosyltransferase regulatory subunit [Lichenihabitans sp. Uapishka_5]|uniref:ATP phosphoribosyltransferase regulatory subunit n=1 Tax=Lichenihabitans sp. Uapishka_5 TaxID=3037302 RepID=UPI003FA5CDBE